MTLEKLIVKLETIKGKRGGDMPVFLVNAANGSSNEISDPSWDDGSTLVSDEGAMAEHPRNKPYVWIDT